MNLSNNSFENVNEIVLFYSSFSNSSKNSIELMKKLNATPAKQILNAVRLDTLESRKTVSRGKWFSVKGVPTIVVTGTDGNIQVFEGEPKTVGWLQGFYRWIISMNSQGSSTGREERYTEHYEQAPPSQNKNSYYPPPYPSGDGEDNPYILQSGNGTKLNFKPVATGPSGPSGPEAIREIRETNNERHTKHTEGGNYEHTEGGPPPPPQKVVYTPDFGPITKDEKKKPKDKKNEKKSKFKEKKANKKKSEMKEEDFDFIDSENFDMGEDTDAVEIEFLDGEPPSRPPAMTSKKSAPPENMETLIQKAKKMAGDMTSQYGYNNNVDE